ncbi:MAG TPA: hypothetical protein GX708_12415 [Gallicola sp.]|nr:hypothetical protein [Gallicola sp.]
MDPIKDKINQILEETKKLVSEKNFEKAIKNLETILVLDPTHEEAAYVLSKIKDREVTTKVLEPNVFIEDNLWGAMVVTKYYVDGIEVARIADKGNRQLTIPIGKHELFIKFTYFGEFRKTFEIATNKTKVHIRTFYKKLGFTFSADVSISD